MASSTSTWTGATNSATVAALVSTGLISLAPNLILLLFPNYASGEGGTSKILSLGQAVAAGGLLGDVFLHALPDAAAAAATASSSGTDASGGEAAGLWVLLGFTAFFVADVVIRALDEARVGGGGGHSHNHGKAAASDGNPAGTTTHPHNSEHKDHQSHRKSLALLNLAADCMHNFTDGLAIGASYAAQKHVPTSLTSVLTSRGGLASLSILFHEIPHELGDFCSLIRAGYSKRQAITAQFLTAIAAFVGTLVALSVAEGWGSDALLLVTAGGFVYLAATTILPEILDDAPSSAWFRVAQVACFGTGIGFLYVVTLLEDDDDHDGHHHHHHHHGHSHGDHSPNVLHSEL